jgi:prepilin-type processing-associated H-X9-DG protein
MDGFDPRAPGSWVIGNWPASYHGRAGGLAFADGHSEIRRWIDSRTTPPVLQDAVLGGGVASPNNPDMEWLMERSSARISNPTR